MSHKHKEREARHVEAQRRADERATARAEISGRGLTRLPAYIRRRFQTALSNLRFSLTLRIALHYSSQLLGTTSFMLLVFTLVFGAAQIPSAERTLDAVAAMKPAGGLAYTAQQLVGLPVNEAYLLAEPLQDGFAGFFESVRLSLADVYEGLDLKE